MIASKQVAGKLQQGCNIYEVLGCKLMPLFSNNGELPASINQFKDGVEKLLSNSGFYFSYYADLTTKQQSASRNKSSDPKYVWNYNILKDFRFQNVSDKWLVPIIQGFVETTL